MRSGLSKCAGALALVLAAMSPATAQLANPLAMTTDPADRTVMAEVAAVLASRTPDLASLDAALRKLPRPTPLRGMVQTVRANLLANDEQPGPAVTAIEEAIRLLPADPRPKLVASWIFTFSGSPQRAADLWIEASRQAPEVARMSDRYLMLALTGRLVDIGDRVRADRLSARLGEIGFSAGTAPDRSSSALARAREAMTAGRTEDALEAISSITDPGDLLTLYADREYAALWPRIAEWAGPDLAQQERRYLEELHAEWIAADDFTTARPYASKLSAMDAHAAVAALFLPMFDRVAVGDEQSAAPLDAEFLAPIVARSLSRLNRGSEALALLAKVAAWMPDGDRGNALNIDAAYLLHAANELDWPQVLSRADGFLAKARVLGSDVNRSAVLQVQAWRACALSRTGREPDAQPDVAEVQLAGALIPGAVMGLHLCRQDADAARALMIARLDDPNTRAWALHFVQPAPRPARTPLEAITHPVAELVRADPQVRQAVERVGRILPNPLNAGLPQGFDPFRTRPRVEPLSPNET